MSAESHVPEHDAMLLLPRIRVQNANAISSPMTWGFPAMSAFTGLMTALERRLGPEAGIAFHGVGVICHAFEAQVTSSGYTRAFHLTRNPVLADGSTAGIVEEGRVHLDLTLVFDVQLTSAQQGEAERAAMAERVSHQLAGMRLAGGSVMPPLAVAARRSAGPALERVPDGDDEQRMQFRRLARRCLPGFALVLRDDLLQSRLVDLRTGDPNATVLDAWLDLSRWNHRAIQQPATDDSKEPVTTWVTDARQGWIVPIPVGFAALSELHPPGAVPGARDSRTPFRFVESIWSMGQWISPHRLSGLNDLFWFPHCDEEAGIYRCRNNFAPRISAISAQD